MARCDSYDPGQCTAGACSINSWVEDGWGNGGQWAASAAADGFQVTATPTVGAVVCYCEGDGYSEFGHVATVTQVFGDGTFEVTEENYVAPFTWDQRRSQDYDVCGFILPPGVSSGTPGVPQGGSGAGSNLGWPGGASQVVAAYDQLRWYFGPTATGQVATLQNMVQYSYLIQGV